MDILVLLAAFFIIATVIKIATDNVVAIFKPWFKLKAYKLVIALVLTSFGVFAFNLGILEALGIPIEVSRPWFHWFDLFITVLFLTSGAQAIHRLSDAWKQYNQARKEGEDI